ncbi:MAG: protein phosphatase 2C domain-containing protein [Pseudomonadota bacterium]
MSDQHSHTDVPGTSLGRNVSSSLSVGALTDAGNCRETNEDSYLVLPERSLLVVSDGMGGHNAGDVASRLVVEALPEMMKNVSSDLEAADVSTQSNIIRGLLLTLSREMWEHSRGRPGIAGMGATVVLAWFADNRVLIAHLGDSRAYLYRGIELKLLTDDHSVLWLLLQSGEITPQEAVDHPARGLLSRYVGMKEKVHPDVQTFDLVSGDRLLLCTDGLTDELDDAAIAAVLGEDTDVQEICASLVAEVKKRGARDNVTVVLAEWRANFDEPLELEVVPDDGDIFP